MVEYKETQSTCDSDLLNYCIRLKETNLIADVNKIFLGS